jgi:hypothetical protein
MACRISRRRPPPTRGKPSPGRRDISCQRRRRCRPGAALPASRGPARDDVSIEGDVASARGVRSVDSPSESLTAEWDRGRVALARPRAKGASRRAPCKGYRGARAPSTPLARRLARGLTAPSRRGALSESPPRHAPRPGRRRAEKRSLGGCRRRGLRCPHPDQNAFRPTQREAGTASHASGRGALSHATPPREAIVKAGRESSSGRFLSPRPGAKESRSPRSGRRALTIALRGGIIESRAPRSLALKRRSRAPARTSSPPARPPGTAGVDGPCLIWLPRTSLHHFWGHAGRAKMEFSGRSNGRGSRLGHRSHAGPRPFERSAATFSWSARTPRLGGCPRRSPHGHSIRRPTTVATEGHPRYPHRAGTSPRRLHRPSSRQPQRCRREAELETAAHQERCSGTSGRARGGYSILVRSGARPAVR